MRFFEIRRFNFGVIELFSSIWMIGYGSLMWISEGIRKSLAHKALIELFPPVLLSSVLICIGIYQLYLIVKREAELDRLERRLVGILSCILLSLFTVVIVINTGFVLAAFNMVLLTIFTILAVIEKF